MTTLVSVGNAHQHFTRLVDGVIAIAEHLPQPVIVQHGHTPCSSGRIRSISFLAMDDFEHILSAASLLIVHAGCGALINAVRNGLTPVVMARRKRFKEHIDDHQVEIVDQLVAQDKIVRADSADDLLDAVKSAMGLQSTTDFQARPPTAVAMVHKILSNYAARAALK
jgi:UDP-N-acetylglucosamine transferase subunit ALG13